jgi:nitrogen fixation protein
MRLAVTALVGALLPAFAVGHLEFFCASSVFSNHSNFCNKAVIWLGSCKQPFPLLAGHSPFVKVAHALLAGGGAYFSNDWDQGLRVVSLNDDGVYPHNVDAHKLASAGLRSAHPSHASV